MSTEHGMPRLARADGLSVYQVHAENLLLKPDNASTVQVETRWNSFRHTWTGPLLETISSTALEIRK